MAQDFFIQRPSITPTIYAYRLIGVKSHHGYIKVGYIDRDVHTRIKEQIGASHVPYELLYQELAMREDGSVFMDHELHAILERKGFHKLNILSNELVCIMAGVQRGKGPAYAVTINRAHPSKE